MKNLLTFLWSVKINTLNIALRSVSDLWGQLRTSSRRADTATSALSPVDLEDDTHSISGCVSALVPTVSADHRALPTFPEPRGKLSSLLGTGLSHGLSHQPGAPRLTPRDSRVLWRCEAVGGARTHTWLLTPWRGRRHAGRERGVHSHLLEHCCEEI